MVTGLQDTCYEARLKELGLTTLETRRPRADLLEVPVFKVMQGSERIDADSLFERSTPTTRGHKWKFCKKNVKTLNATLNVTLKNAERHCVQCIYAA